MQHAWRVQLQGLRARCWHLTACLHAQRGYLLLLRVLQLQRRTRLYDLQMIQREEAPHLALPLSPLSL